MNGFLYFAKLTLKKARYFCLYIFFINGIPFEGSYAKAANPDVLQAKEDSPLQDVHHLAKQKLKNFSDQTNISFSPIVLSSEKKSSYNTGHRMHELFYGMQNEDTENFDKALACLRKGEVLEVSTYITQQILNHYYNILMLIHQEGVEEIIAKTWKTMKSFFDLGKVWLALNQVKDNFEQAHKKALKDLDNQYNADRQSVLTQYTIKNETLDEAIKNLELRVSEPSLNREARNHFEKQLQEKQTVKATTQAQKKQEQVELSKAYGEEEDKLVKKYQDYYTTFNNMLASFKVKPFWSYASTNSNIINRGEAVDFYKWESMISSYMLETSTKTLLSSLLKTRVYSGKGLLSQRKQRLGSEKSCLEYMEPHTTDKTGLLLFDLLEIAPDFLQEAIQKVKSEAKSPVISAQAPLSLTRRFPSPYLLQASRGTVMRRVFALTLRGSWLSVFPHFVRGENSSAFSFH